jgi:hypothetical protein
MDITLRFARRNASGGWTTGELAAGESLHGFFNTMTARGSALLVATYYYDRAFFPPGALTIVQLP